MTFAEQFARRHQAAQLLEDVLDERLVPQLAINRWPEPTNIPDESLDCAFKALWHFEADEQQQKSEVYYIDLQLELLRQMAVFLKKGHDLPAYLLSAYGVQPIKFYYQRTPWKDYCIRVQERWARLVLLWQKVWSVSPIQK